LSDAAAAARDVVATAAEAAALEQEPLIIIEPLQAFLDDTGLGSGPLSATPIGGGHSNVTYALDRGNDRYVLRRPPRGPLPASTHDMLREARLLRALAAAGVRVPEVLAICESADVVGAPFYLMPFIDGHVLDRELPPQFAGPGAGHLIAEQLVDALIELHAVDVSAGELATFGRPSGYLERQIRRFRDLLDRNATRPLPDLETVADWLEANRPDSAESTVVHGDYRLGNVMFAAQPPPRIVALLDWEMATLGDPLADVGYLTAMWAETNDPPDPMLDLSEVTRQHGFPDRRALTQRYVDGTGRDLAALGWYQTLALWKAAIFLEGSYQRYLAGSTHDTYFARLEGGVPALASRALRHVRTVS
jgi:aminoglycoside phosphotransferase (APT) family kinase protein